MTTFNYSSGDPDDLTAGNSADMNDLKGSFADIKTFLNGANLDGTNIALLGVGTSQVADAAVTPAKLANLAIHMGSLTKINAGLTLTSVPAGSSLNIIHGLGVTALLFVAMPWAVGNPASPGAVFNGDIPNSTHLRIYNTGTTAAAGAAWVAFA